MKKLLIILLGVGVAFMAHSTSKPDPVPSKLTEIKAKSWYMEAFRSWKTYLETNPTDRQGWMEFTKAANYAKLPKEEWTPFIDQLKLNLPESFEANYALAKYHGWNTQGVSFLEQAIELKGEKNLLEEQIILAEYQLNDRSSYSGQLYESGMIHKSTLNYAYNVLMSVGDQGILFTEATHSTIPLWLLQDVMGVRTDVQILNLELSQDTDYLERKLQTTGLNQPTDELLANISSANTDRDFYYALSLRRDRLTEVEDRLYVVGLASKLDAQTFDANETLKENIENKFLLDYLTIDFNGEPNTSTGRVFEQNYIVPFLLLKEYYDDLENEERASYWTDMILKIADRSQLKTRVELLLNRKNDSRTDFAKTELDVKELDKKMKQIKGNLYASEFEVTNREFWFYLGYLYKNGYTEIYEKSVVDLSKYDGLTRSLLANYHYSPVNAQVASVKKSWIDKYHDYPAIDMTFEAAKTYCEWLTAQYNTQENRKYKKVKFRLPTKNEWQIAALGYKDFTSWNLEENTVKAWDNWVEGKGTKKNKKDIKEFKLSQYEILYPWWYPNINFRNKINNYHGCYLANVKTPEEVECKAGLKGDGFTLMSPAGTYFANRMGLYDVIGNVAEMINEEGKAMGGSWNHPAEESTIKSVNLYDEADASVGFRLFMEVIEE